MFTLPKLLVTLAIGLVILLILRSVNEIQKRKTVARKPRRKKVQQAKVDRSEALVACPHCGVFRAAARSCPECGKR